MSLLTEYPVWFLLFCILAGAFFSVGLYYGKRRTDDGLTVFTALLLLRFFSVTVISFLLLNPLVQRTTRQVEKPVIAVGIDGSRSLVSSVDSVEVRENIGRDIENLSHELSDRFEFAFYTFGQDVSGAYVIWEMSVERNFSRTNSGWQDRLDKRNGS